MLKIVRLFSLLLALSLIVACSDSESDSAVKKQTDRVAQEAIDSIKTPIEQSKVVVEALNIRNDAVKGATEKVQE